MQIKQENIDSNTIKFEIIISKEKLEPSLQKSYLKNVKNIFIPGFRKGKVPRNVVERYYGKDILFNDAFNFFLPTLYNEIVKDNKLDPISQPEYRITKINDDGSVEVEMIIYNKPNFELPNYKEYDLKLEEAIATDEEVKELIDTEIEKSVRIVSVERTAQIGDLVNFNFEGFLNNKPFEGGKAENFELILGEKKFIDGFEDNLIGHNIDEEFQFNITFPSDYHMPTLAGQETVFKIKINSIKEKQFPIFDDEFVQDVSLFSTIDEYTADLKNKIIEKNNEKNKQDLQNKILNKLVEDTIVEIPKVMLDNYVNKALNQIISNLQSNNLTLQQYLDHNNTNIEELREKMEPRALIGIKMNLIIEKIAQIENIEISQKDFTGKITELIEKHKLEMSQVNNELVMEIKQTILHDKTIEFLGNIYINKPLVN